MKTMISRIIKTSIAVFVIIFTACEDGNEIFDQIQRDVTRGAVLRTTNLISNELPIGVADAGFAVELEVQDQENGDLLSNLEVFIGFRDNVIPEAGTDKTTAEALYATIPASEFTTGPFGLPRTTFEVSLAEMLAFTGVTEADLFGGDQFTVRFELNLTDGRSFSNDDNSGTITGSFFSSPFLYTPTVVCPVGEDQFVGTYITQQVVPGIFASSTWGDGTEVEISIGATSTQRTFSAVYLPAFGIGNGPQPFVFDLVCESIDVPSGQASGLQCAAGITFGPPVDADNGTYDPFDDSVFTITFRDDEADDCGGGVDATVRFTKM